MLLPDGTPDTFAEILAQLQNVHVFVSIDVMHAAQVHSIVAAQSCGGTV